MQIVIEMPEDEFEAICRQVTSGHEFSYGYIAIANGTPLNKIRAEIHATAEMHEDGDYYLRDEWIDEIIDKYREGKE